MWRPGRLEALEPRLLLAGEIVQVNVFETWNADPRIIESTDPAGIAYHAPSGHLFIADSEINEISEFNDKNVFESALDGAEVFSESWPGGDLEPTGITWNAADGHFYITNDSDRVIKRFDETLTFEKGTVQTSDYGVSDPEGITSDPSGLLYVISGHHLLVGIFDNEFNFMGSFSVGDEIQDAEGIAYNALNNHLYIVSGVDQRIVEYTVDGDLVETYSLAELDPQPQSAQGLTFAPCTDDPGLQCLYIADGGVDNKPDGRVYEVRIGETMAPDQPPAFIALNPIHDVHTRPNNSRNYGDVDHLRARTGKSIYHSYLKFDVSGLEGAVRRATLRLFVVDDSDEGGQLYAVSNHYADSTTAWEEDGLTGENAPGISGTLLDSAGAVEIGTWVEFDVTAAITGNGNYSFGLISDSSNSVMYSSSEGDHPPQLIVESTPVAPNNEPPVAENQSLSTDEDIAVATRLTGSDPDGDSLNFVIATDPAHGILTGAAPNLIYTPHHNFNGSDSFTFKANDGFTDSQPATVSITIKAIDDPPAFTSDLFEFFVSEHAVALTAVGTVAATDPEGDATNYSIVGGNEAGKFSIAPATGVITTAAALDFEDTASYTLTIKAETAGSAASSTAEVMIFVSDVTPLITSFEPSVGSVGDTVVITGSGFTGTAVHFNGVAADFTIDSDTQISAIVPSGATTGPISVVTDEGTGISDLAFTVRTAPTITGFSPSSGAIGDEVALAGSGFTSVSNVSFNGVSASFQFDSDTQLRATVPTGASTGPISVTTDVGTAATLQHFMVTTPVPAPIVTLAPIHDVHTRPSNSRNYGDVDHLRARHGKSIYHSYLKFDVSGLGGSAQRATLRLFVVDDSDEGGKLYAVSNHYADSTTPWEQDGLTGENAPDIGGTLLDSAGAVETGEWVEFDVTAAITGNGIYSFGLISDSSNSVMYSSTEGDMPPQLVVEATGLQANHRPVADDLATSTSEDAAVTITLTGSDLDGDPLGFSIEDGPSNGALSGTAPNLTYTPNENFHGSDSFRFQVNDSTEDSDLATVSISVAAVNDPPVADDLTRTTTGGTAVSIPLSGSDVDGDALSYVVLSNPSNGSLQGTAPNLTYTPDDGFVGADSFTYEAGDESSTSNVATVTVHVTSASNPVTISFQDEVFPSPSYRGTRDTKLRGDFPDEILGTSRKLEMDGNPDIATLIKWDISAIASGSFVQSASITIEVVNTSDDEFEIYQALRDWAEAEASYNERQAGVAWQTAGAQGAADRGSTVLGTVTGPVAGTTTIELNNAGRAIVQSWIDDPSRNFGFVIQDYADASTQDLEFHSREGRDAWLRPKLTVVYAGEPVDFDDVAGFDIDLVFAGDTITSSQRRAVRQAADRWSEIIIGDLPELTNSSTTIDDLLIEVSLSSIDGAGGVLANAGPTFVRSGTFLPARGVIRIDQADLAALESSGRFVDLILHEMGHVLGIGTIWRSLGLLAGRGTDDPRFLGVAATAEYNRIFGRNESSVPVENTGGSGTSDAHWRESVFGSEIMTGFLDDVINPISSITVASLQDLGYEVDLDKADAFSPSLSSGAGSELIAAIDPSPGSALIAVVEEQPAIQIAAPWRNTSNAADVNGDGYVSPLDALQVINELNSIGARPLPGAKTALHSFVDVSGDNFVSAVDALLVINALNRMATASSEMLAEAGPVARAEARADVSATPTAHDHNDTFEAENRFSCRVPDLQPSPVSAEPCELVAAAVDRVWSEDAEWSLLPEEFDFVK